LPGEKEQLPLKQIPSLLNYFSSIFVVYHNPSRKDTFSPDCRVEKIVVRDLKGKTTEINGDTIPVPLSIAVREKAVEKIDVYFSR